MIGKPPSVIVVQEFDESAFWSVYRSAALERAITPQTLAAEAAAAASAAALAAASAPTTVVPRAAAGSSPTKR